MAVLDVRDRDAFAAWRLDPGPGGRLVNLPLAELEADPAAAAERVAGARLVRVICSAGNTSRAAAGILAGLGLEVASVHTGMIGWSRVLASDEVAVPGPARVVQFRRQARGCLSYLVECGGLAVVVDPAPGYRSLSGRGRPAGGPHRRRGGYARARRPPVGRARAGRAGRARRCTCRARRFGAGSATRSGSPRSRTGSCWSWPRADSASRTQPSTLFADCAYLHACSISRSARVAEPQSISSELSRLVGLYSLTWSQFYYTVPTMPGDVLASFTALHSLHIELHLNDMHLLPPTITSLAGYFPGHVDTCTAGFLAMLRLPLVKLVFNSPHSYTDIGDTHIPQRLRVIYRHCVASARAVSHHGCLCVRSHNSPNWRLAAFRLKLHDCQHSHDSPYSDCIKLRCRRASGLAVSRASLIWHSRSHSNRVNRAWCLCFVARTRAASRDTFIDVVFTRQYTDLRRTSASSLVSLTDLDVSFCNLDTQRMTVIRPR